MTDDLAIRVTDDSPEAGWSRLTLTGRVSVSSAKRLHAAALELRDGGNDVVVDCGGVTGIDAAGIQLLHCLSSDSARRGRACEFAGVSDALRGDFSLAGADGALPSR